MIKKEGYFDNGQEISNVYGKDIRKVLSTVASRYMGENPSLPFGFHVFHKDGFLCLPDGRFNLNLDEHLSESKAGQVSYICTKFWKEKKGVGSFLLSCYGPTTIYINGKLEHRSTVREDVNVLVKKEIELPYEKGWNLILIKCMKTASGFGCILGPNEPRWNWIPFMVPFEGREGQLGFAYSQILDDDIMTEERLSSINMNVQEEETNVSWFPRRDWGKEKQSLFALERIYGMCARQSACGWSSIFWDNTKSTYAQLKLKTYGKTEVYLDGIKVLVSEQDICIDIELTYGTHSIFIVSQCLHNERWGFLLEILSLEGKSIPFHIPCNIHGAKDPWLYLGPFEQINKEVRKMETLYGVFGDDTKVYWQVDEPLSYVRPVLENPCFGRWNYPLGVTLYGLLETARLLESNEMMEYVTSHISECVRMYEYSLWDATQYGYPEINNQLVGMEMLDDCGSFGSIMLELSNNSLEPYTRLIGDRIANHMENQQERQPDGSFYRKCVGHFMENTLWVDDLYMSVPFLCRYYEMSGNETYIEDAINQFIQFKKYLFIPEEKVMSHVYDFKYNTATKIPWGRGNGWCFFSLSELLEFIPQEHEKYPVLLGFFNELSEGYLSLQGTEGLWHQLLTHPDSYEESSCTAMFVYGLCRGIRHGWLKEDNLKRAIEAAKLGWEGLIKKSIDRQGNVHGICGGSAYSFTPRYYKEELLWITNDPHGIGIVLLAGIEMEKLELCFQHQI